MAAWGDEAAAVVAEKIATGEIKIGPPTALQPGDRIRVIDSGLRYAIETREPGDPRRDTEPTT